MSQKASVLPSLTGHRLKTRKRDEKKQFDPIGFRDAIVAGLNEAGDDLDAVSKFLESQSSKLDYRRYGCELIEILVVGGLLAPGGSILQDDGSLAKTSTSVFGDCVDSLERIRQWTAVFTNLFRRYKYLEKMHEDAAAKLFIYLKAFSADNRLSLAQMTAMWLIASHLPANSINLLASDQQVKNGLCMQFLLDMLITIKEEKGGQVAVSLLKKAAIDTRLTDFFPSGKQGEFISILKENNLDEVVDHLQLQSVQQAKNDLARTVVKAIGESRRKPQDIASSVRESAQMLQVADGDVAVLMWDSIMKATDWPKKEEQIQEQALKHIKNHVPLLAAFAQTPPDELMLLNRVQGYCYENASFFKLLGKIVVLLYKTEVLTEDVILKWYRGAHSSRGWFAFHEQIKKFVEWLEQAEEDSSDADDDAGDNDPSASDT